MNSKLSQLINDSGYDIFFLVVDKFLNFNVSIGLSHFYPIFFPELDLKNSGQLLAHPKVQDYIKKISQQNNHQIAILSFKPSAKIEHICLQNDWKCLNNPASLNRLFEDKIKFFDICQKNQISIPPSNIDIFNQSSFIKYQQIWGGQIVIQSHFGWAGNCTFSANKWEDIADKIPLDSIVKFSKFITGTTLLNNCCLTHLGLLQSPPADQLTGLPQYTFNKFSTVGRQWPSSASLNTIHQISEITQKFSKILTKSLYKGYFGLDFIVDNSENVYLLECNPRLTASFAFYSSIETNCGLTPLFLFHLAEFLLPNYQFDLTLEQARFLNSNIIGTQITPRLNPQNRITEVIEHY